VNYVTHSCKFMGMPTLSSAQGKLRVIDLGTVFTLTFLWFLNAIQFAIKMFTDLLDKDLALNTFTAIVDLSQFNNSCLKWPASTLVDLIFQSHSFSFNQLRDLSLLAGNLYSSFSKSS